MLHADDVEIKNSDLVYDGVFKLKSLELRFKQYSGEWSPWIRREQITRHDAVAVILYDPNEDKVVLVEQLRIGALRQDNDHSPWLLEIVAGLCDYDEPLTQTARRESLEEADCEIEHLMPICDFYTTPGGFTEKTHIFCGIVNANTTGKWCGNAHEQEDIQVKVLPVSEVLQDLAQGRLVTSASTVIALLWLQHKRLDPKWQWR